MRVLVVEDDPDLADLLRTGLAEEGYAVDLCTDGEDGLWRATTVDYDAAVLDMMLPGHSGLDILRGMRRRGRSSPVLFLTARDTTEARVEGLDAGADDYLVKPFAWDELLARLRVLIRRGVSTGDGRLRFAGLTLDPARRSVACGEDPLAFTAKEFELVYVLMREPERVFTRTELIEHAYDDDFDAMSNTLDVLVSRIRRKLKHAATLPDPCTARIRTVRGVGYALTDEADA